MLRQRFIVNNNGNTRPRFPARNRSALKSERDQCQASCCSAERGAEEQCGTMQAIEEPWRRDEAVASNARPPGETKRGVRSRPELSALRALKRPTPNVWRQERIGAAQFGIFNFGSAPIWGV